MLSRRWPDPAAALSRVAAHQRAALSLLEPLAERDGREAVDASGAFSIAAMREWSGARTANALRRWISDKGLPLPDSRKLERIHEEVIGARSDAAPVLRWPGAELHRYRGRLHVQAPPPSFDPCRTHLWENIGVPLKLEHGLLRARAERGSGLSARCVSAFPLTVRFRRGGERARPSGRARSQTLKKLFQEHGVPPWERNGCRWSTPAIVWRRSRTCGSVGASRRKRGSRDGAFIGPPTLPPPRRSTERNRGPRRIAVSPPLSGPERAVLGIPALTARGRAHWTDFRRQRLAVDDKSRHTPYRNLPLRSWISCLPAGSERTAPSDGAVRERECGIESAHPR